MTVDMIASPFSESEASSKKFQRLEQRLKASLAACPDILPTNETTKRAIAESALDFFSEALAEEQHLWCLYSAHLKHLMWLFTLPDSEWPRLKALKQKSNEALQLCHVCIEEYHLMLSQVPSLYSAKAVPSASLKALLKTFDDADAERLAYIMLQFGEQADTSMDANLLRAVKLAVYEIVAFPYLLRREAVYTQFGMVIHAMHRTRKKFQLKKILPGLLLCLFSPQRHVREWSMVNFRRRLEEGETIDPTEPVLKALLAELHRIVSSGLLNVKESAREDGCLPIVTVDGVHDRYKITCQATEFLYSLALALSALSTEAPHHVALATSMLADLSKYLVHDAGTDGRVFWHALQAISVLLSRFKCRLWQDAVRPTPTQLLDLILEPVSLFESVFETTAEDTDLTLHVDRPCGELLACSALLRCFCWTRGYLESLVEHEQFAALFRRLTLFLTRELVMRQASALTPASIQSKWHALSLSLYFLQEPKSRQLVRTAFGDLEWCHVLLLDAVAVETVHPSLRHLAASLIQSCIEIDAQALHQLYTGCFEPTVTLPATRVISHDWANFWHFLASVSPLHLPARVHNSLLLDLVSSISLMGAPKNDRCFRHLVASNQHIESLGSACLGVDTLVHFLTRFLCHVERLCDDKELYRIYHDLSLVQPILCLAIHFDEGLRSAALRLFAKIAGCPGRLSELLGYFYQHASQHSLESVCHIFERYEKWASMNIPMFCFVTRLSELASATLNVMRLASGPDRPIRSYLSLFQSVWCFNFDVISSCLFVWKAFDKHELLSLLASTLALLVKQVALYQSHSLLGLVARMTSQHLQKGPEPSLSDSSDTLVPNARFAFSQNGEWFPLLLECYSVARRLEAEHLCSFLYELIQSVFHFWMDAKVELDFKTIRHGKVFVSSRISSPADVGVSDMTQREQVKQATVEQARLTKLFLDYEKALGLPVFGLSKQSPPSTNSSSWSILSSAHATDATTATTTATVKTFTPIASINTVASAKTAATLAAFCETVPPLHGTKSMLKKPSAVIKRPLNTPAVGPSQTAAAANNGSKLQQIKSSILRDMSSHVTLHRVTHVPSKPKSSIVTGSRRASNSDASEERDDHERSRSEEEEDDLMDDLLHSFKRKSEDIDLDAHATSSASLRAAKGRLLEKTATSKSIQLIDDPKLKRTTNVMPYLAKKELFRSPSSKLTTRTLAKPGVILDTASFHRALLSWPYHDLTEATIGCVSHGDEPMALSTVPHRFDGYDQYATVFEPLLLSECRAQILKSKNELCYSSKSDDYGLFHLKSVAMTDRFHDLQFGFEPYPSSSTLPSATSLSSPAQPDAAAAPAKTPLKLDSLDTFPFAEHDYLYLEPTKISPLSVGTLAIGLAQSRFQPAVQTNKYATAIVTGVAMKFGEVVLSVRMLIDPMDPRHLVSELRDRTEWHVIRVCSLVTVHREYMALSQVTAFPLFPYIMDPLKLSTGGLSVPSRELTERVPHIASFFKVNESQALAIAASIHHPSPLVLVQGPPGTGKTTTILSMISYYIGVHRSAQAGKEASEQRGGRLTNTRIAHMIPAATSVSSSSSARSTLDKKLRKPLLVCAPSNAAVDEIVKRLVQGIAVYDPDRSRPSKTGSSSPVRYFKPNVVRVGNSDVIHDDVRPYTLDYLMQLEEKHAKHTPSPTDALDLAKCQEELALVRQALDGLDGSGPPLELSPENDLYGIANMKASELYSRKKALQQLDSERRKTSKKESKEARLKLRMMVLDKADIICSTLSGSGHDLLAKWEGQSGLGSGIAFDTVIIDEACQSVELSSLIPLRYGARRCILVGDPNQLPPTVLSQAALGFAYEQSLFNRIQAVTPHIVYLLSVQYRMHPEISVFPSQYFYQGRLQDSPDLALATQRDWHRCDYTRPFLFFHVPGNQARGNGSAGKTATLSKSLMNAMEADMAVALVHALCSGSPHLHFSGKIGIISPYKQQVREIKQRLLRSFPAHSRALFKHIDVQTVDGFQGQEKEIIIFSCVRASASGSIGFLNDTRRMNVALTRAKCSLFVLGNANALTKHPIWHAMIQNATERHCYIDYPAPFLKEMNNNVVPANLFT